MTNPVEVKVNVINQLKLLRQSTFKDKLSFLDEDIQNAQRAKATEVKVNIDYCNKKVTIENNGKTLQNPQALFSIAESEWDEDIQKSESPFGMGFFSNITVSDYIEVYTGNKHIIFNVSDMIQNNKTQIEVNEIANSYDGFKLILNNFDFNQVTSTSIRERVEMLGKYIHELDIYCDNVMQEKKDLTEGDGSVFLSKINDEFIKGWIALSGGFCQDLNVFYKGRFVTKLDNLYYIKGDLHITDKTLNLTSPDRKDIIRDSKYLDFLSKVKTHIQELANSSFLNGEQKYIDNHIDSISYYADKNKLKNEMTFLIFNTEDEKDSKYLSGIALAKRDNSEMKTINQYEVFLKSEAAKQSESHYDEVQIEHDVMNKAPKAEGIQSWRGDEGSSGGYSEPEINEEKLEERKGKHLDFESEPVFWLGFDQVIEQEAKFKIAEHYKLKIIVSRNKFESSVLELLGKEQNIVHISQLTEKTKIKASLSNTELQNVERRAMMLLDMVSRMVGFNRNVFAIGDLMVLKETSVEVLGHTIESIEDKFIAIHDRKNNKIYIDRTSIDKTKLRNDLNDNLDLEDYKFILFNLKEIVRELNLMNYDEINNKPDDLYERIINTLAVA
ncbi:hypothetical protein SAMN04487895_101495 [Paenibacillus sophorae]|uniref:Histidine kinase-, DNA gyrase B-, and HSP90-like ATPase n=1 Tax=Paenibacillus sophorae TaxID=1333845 RepID=A0A1H8GFF3_9BACL|nr:hypothetical protein [Paenibacillus sophorae]QWU14206.1 hypothetical protein KP014_20045 [Paenibacillus sophorae]SEN42722.1 hypothetical protein SAMN04487895_101495 [Paenibacillus sophorae]